MIFARIILINDRRWIVVLWLLFVGSIYGKSQDSARVMTVSRVHAVSFNVAGSTPIIGLTYERLLSHRFSAEVGLGVISVGVAVRFFPFGIIDNKMVFHTGIGSSMFATPFDNFSSSDYSSTTYVMIGLSYYGIDGFNFGIDIGPSINYDFTFNEISRPFYGNLKIGYRF